MKILLVVAHSRPDSLTAQAAHAFEAAALEAGHAVEYADLVAEGFDPNLMPVDEPDWNDPAKVYSAEVRQEIQRVERNEATVIFFPVWWWSMPAILKGWIDRVWTYGWAYGGNTYPHRRVLMVGIAGNAQEAYLKRGYDKAMQTQIATGILDYCGVEQGELKVLYGTIEADTDPTATLKAAADLGRSF